MRDKAEAKLKEPGGTTGSFLEDALFASVFVELEGLWNEPKSDTVTSDQSTTIRRIYNFLLESLTLASGTTWHSIYYPAYTDRFYVLAGALATAVPQSRRTLGLMMGVHRQKRPKPADKKKFRPKAPAPHQKLKTYSLDSLLFPVLHSNRRRIGPKFWLCGSRRSHKRKGVFMYFFCMSCRRSSPRCFRFSWSGFCSRNSPRCTAGHCLPS